ncbi:hypothetical protein [Treponema putidum]|uniref:DUF8091 domain-containing protein n=1 Tax=Treponema putidum TaxID=221027 RepID=A0AAE9MUU9_9SPIR|nr:hypothetical protein [Treponema putidum]TWI79827.1 hypothetical protein JM98_00258 [Treponema putidum]UTY28277.1 hypothetical protein E4N76_04270 [Treponema putidum]UTY30770.1 hypothetical protein E4N75_03855 [Treponema putidum]UTY33192.1 hypothetical protein E4N74_03585 [Treponema putidum]
MINTYNESDLHKSLKEHFCPKNGKTEQPLLRSVCDILCDGGQVIEIQTSNLSALRLKLEKFLPEHKVLIVYPIAVDSYIRVLNQDGSTRYRRKSPKHGFFFQIFKELSGLYHLIDNKNLSFKLVYISCEVIKTDRGIKRRRAQRPGVINKKLIKIHSSEEYTSIKSICKKVLDFLPEEFTNQDIKNLGAKKYTSYTSWFLKKAGIIKADGKKERFTLYKKIKNL